MPRILIAMSDERKAPERIRVIRLQEIHLVDLEKVDHACAAMYHAIGFTAAEVPTRSAADLAMLTRFDNVFSAEGDDWKPIGYAAWRAEPSDVAYIEAINVHPDVQRFGVGGKLLEALRDDAHKAELEHIVVRVWTKATWAMAFYRKHGFVEVDGATLPGDVKEWLSGDVSGRLAARPGEVILFAPVRAKDPDELPEESLDD